MAKGRSGGAKRKSHKKGVSKKLKSAIRKEAKAVVVRERRRVNELKYSVDTTFSDYRTAWGTSREGCVINLGPTINRGVDAEQGVGSRIFAKDLSVTLRIRMPTVDVTYPTAAPVTQYPGDACFPPPPQSFDVALLAVRKNVWDELSLGQLIETIQDFILLPFGERIQENIQDQYLPHSKAMFVLKKLKWNLGYHKAETLSPSSLTAVRTVCRGKQGTKMMTARINKNIEMAPSGTPGPTPIAWTYLLYISCASDNNDGTYYVSPDFSDVANGGRLDVKRCFTYYDC